MSSEMKEMSSVCLMSYPGERFQQEPHRNLDIDPLADLDGTDPSMGQLSQLGQLGDLTNPVGATIMDWTERLIELTLSTDEVTVGTEHDQPSSVSSLSTSENMCTPSSCTASSCTPSSGALEIVTTQETEDHEVDHEQPDFSGNFSFASTFPASSAEQSSVAFSVSNTSSNLNTDMLDTSGLILSSWAAEDLHCNNEHMVMTTAATTSSIDAAIFTTQDHQYSSPMHEGVTFLSQTIRQAPSQSAGSFDESSLDTPPSLLSVRTSAGSWSGTIDLENATPSTVPSTPLYSPSHTVSMSTSAVFSPDNYDTNAVSGRISTNITNNYQIYDTYQTASSTQVTDNILDSFGEEVNQTILDATDAFIDFATVEVGQVKSSVSASTVEVDSQQANQTFQIPLQLPACYSGTVTICRADDIPISLRTENSALFQAPSTIGEASYSSRNPANTPEQSSFDLETLIPQALRSCLGISDTVDDLSLDVSPANHQGSERKSQHQSTNLWSSDFYIFPNEERDQRMFSSVESTETSMSTQEQMSCNSHHPESEKFVSSCDVSKTFPGAYSLLKQTGPSVSVSGRCSQQRTPKPIFSTLQSTSRQSAPNMSLLQPPASLCVSSTDHLASASNPPPSDLSTDALLSPSDVYRTFLPASDSHKVSASNASSSSRTRTISDASDTSMTDSEISGSYSAPSVSSLAELENTESFPTGNKLKDTLRSRLKAKRRTAEEVQQISSVRSMSCSASNFPAVSGSDLQCSSHTGPTRCSSHTGPTRCSSHTGPTRCSSHTGPTRCSSHTGPTRCSSHTGPTRCSSHTGPTRPNQRLQDAPSTSHGSDPGQLQPTRKMLKDKNPDFDHSDEDDDDKDDDEDDSHDDSEDDDSGQSSPTTHTRMTSRKRKSEQPEEDEETRLAKREKNRLAARKCRHKKVTKIETLTAQVQRLEEKQSRIKTEVDRLEVEREQLQEMLRLHSLVCPSKGKGKPTK